MRTTTGGSPITIRHTIPEDALRALFEGMSDDEWMAGILRAEDAGEDGLLFLDENGVGYFKK